MISNKRQKSNQKNVNFKEINALDLASVARSLGLHVVNKSGQDWLEDCPFCGKNGVGHCAIDRKSNKLKCFRDSSKPRSVIDLAMAIWNLDSKKAAQRLSDGFLGTTSTLENLEIERKIYVQKANEESKAKIELARKKYKAGRKLEPQEIAAILERRHFPSDMIETAKAFFEDVRIGFGNKGLGESLLIPFFDESHEIQGIQRISLANFEKMSLGKIHPFFLAGKGESKACFVVESFFNGLALATIGYSAFVLFGKGGIERAIELSKKKGLEPILWLDHIDATEKQREICEKHSIRGIEFEPQKPSGYDVNNALQDMKSDFIHYVRSKLEQAGATYLISSQLVRWIFLIAATGLGKTFGSIVDAIKKVLAGEKVLFICDTKASIDRLKAEIENAIDKLWPKDIERPKISVLCQGNQEDFSSDDATPGSIAITHIFYLFRKHETQGAYVQALRAIEDRFVVIDEAQVLAEYMFVQIALCARMRKIYLEKGKEMWRIARRCPKRKASGTCQDCALAFSRIKAKGDFEGHFPIEIENLDQEESTKPMVEGLNFDNALKSATREVYCHAFSTCFVRKIDRQEIAIKEMLEVSQLKKSWGDYLQGVFDCLFEPEFRKEFPILFDQKAENKVHFPLESYEIEWHDKVAIPAKNLQLMRMWELKKPVIQFPVNPCLPKLCGQDTFPLQVLGKVRITYEGGKGQTITREFKGAKGALFISATMPNSLIETAKKVAKAKRIEIEVREIAERPYSFDVTVIRTEKRIAFELFSHKMLVISGFQGLFVYESKESAKAAFEKRKNKDNPDFFLFDQGNFLNVEATLRSAPTKTWKAIFTYPLASFCKGSNLPTINFITIDCGSLLPYIAFKNLHAGMDQEAMDREKTKALQDSIRQIVGRAMRSLLPRIPGQTVRDCRKILVALHNLPANLKPELDMSLLHNHDEISETWLSNLETEDCNLESSVLDSITRILAGQKPQNWQEIDSKKALEAALKKGQRSISQTQRKALDQGELEAKRQEFNEEKMQDRLKQRVKELKTQGKTWSEVKRILHLLRYPDILQELANIFNEKN